MVRSVETWIALGSTTPLASPESQESEHLEWNQSVLIVLRARQTNPKATGLSFIHSPVSESRPGVPAEELGIAADGKACTSYSMHRWSKLFVPTLREAPSDAEVASHKFLLRAGYIRQLGAGLYNYLFLGQRSLNKITAIVREEMDKIGQEFYLPGILPREPWEESGRWTGMGDNMFRLKDRKGADLCLGMTHEEIMTTIAQDELRSYKQLPQI